MDEFVLMEAVLFCSVICNNKQSPMGWNLGHAREKDPKQATKRPQLTYKSTLHQHKLHPLERHTPRGLPPVPVIHQASQSVSDHKRKHTPRHLSRTQNLHKLLLGHRSESD